MEEPTPFDLNRAIQDWRESLAQFPAFRRKNLDELELHLRDAIATLKPHALSDEEALVVATKRIGSESSLEKEFGKVNGGMVWLDRVMWMLIGIQLWGFVSGASNFITRNGLAFAWKAPEHGISSNLYSGDVVWPVAAYAFVKAAALAAGLTLCWWLISRNAKRLGGWLERSLNRRSAFIATCTGLCLAALVVSVLNHSSTFFMAKSMGPEALGASAFYFGYAQLLILLPIQIVTMMAVTLVLARKRLHPGRA
jgi:hypothetical protein